MAIKLVILSSKKCQNLRFKTRTETGMQRLTAVNEATNKLHATNKVIFIQRQIVHNKRSAKTIIDERLKIVQNLCLCNEFVYNSGDNLKSIFTLFY